MKKIIFFLIMIACILTISGCEKGVTENKPLEIERVYTTSIFPNVINKDDYKNIKFYPNSSTIEMFFNQDIVDNNYTLGFFSGGKYYAVKSEYDEENYVFYKYIIEKNKLIIKPIGNYHQYGTIEALYIPSTITSINDAKLSEEKLFLMSQFENEDIHFSINDKFELDEQRNVYSQSIAKYKNDGNIIAFLNNNDSYMYSDTNEASATLKVYKGENVVIKDETDTMYLVEIYFNKIDATDAFNKDFKKTESNEFDVVEGYIKKSNLTMVEEPFNDNIYYLVKTVYFNDMGLCEFYIDYSVVNDYFGAESLKIGDNISNIDKNDLYMLECFTLTGWINGYFDNFSKSFFSSVSNLNSELPKLDKNAHMPELAWSENDYNSYVKAVNFYNNYLINYLKRNKVVDELSGFMDDLLYKIKTITVLQELWIDWGYKNKLENENYMFEEIFNRLDLSNEQNLEIKNIFLDAETEVDESKKIFTEITPYDIQNMLFDKKLYAFYNDYSSESDVLQFKNYFDEMMLQKYYKRENFEFATYEQIKIDAPLYYNEQLRLAEIEIQENKKRRQAIIDSGSDISEVDEVLAIFVSLSDEEKINLIEKIYSESDEYNGEAIICTVEEKQCVKGKSEILLKIKIDSIKDDESKLEVGNVYDVIFTNNYPDAKESINVLDKLRLGVKYKKDDLYVLYSDYFMVIGQE